MNDKGTGAFIAEMRKKKGMTQKELAEIIGVSDKTISKWETGKSMPDLSYLESLCKALNITVNELLSGQQLSESDYSQKAEETIMLLMKENENNKTKNNFLSIIGILLIILAIGLQLICTSSGVQGAGGYLTMYVDVISLIVVVLPAIGAVLLSKKKSILDSLKLLDRVVVPIGAISSLSSLVIIMNIVKEMSLLGPYLSVCILSILYAVIIKVAVILLIASKE